MPRVLALSLAAALISAALPSTVLAAPSEPAAEISAAAAAQATAVRLQTIDTSKWNPGSPDPSGLAYIPPGDSPIADRLVVVDGEVEETTGANWHDYNVWVSTRFSANNGSATPKLNTLVASPSNNEPVGTAYDPVDEKLYISKDGSDSKVWVYKLNPDGTFTQSGYFAVKGSGVSDAEGLAFNREGGQPRLYVADGTGGKVVVLDPANNMAPVRTFDTKSLGITDPEGIGVDPGTGNLWVVSHRAKEGIAEFKPTGELLTSVSYASGSLPTSPGGLEVAPSSSGSGNSIWIADRGLDNNSHPTENDGKLYEYSIGGGGTTPPPPPPSGTNLIPNGGFESASGGHPTAWSTDARFTQSSATKHAGDFSGLHSATNNSGYKITQDVPVVGGTTYGFSVWANAPATPDAFKVLFKIQWRASGKISVVTLGKVTKPTGGWTQISGTVTAPGNAATARVMMVVSSLNASVYVDDFALTAP